MQEYIFCWKAITGFAIQPQNLTDNALLSKCFQLQICDDIQQEDSIKDRNASW